MKNMPKAALSLTEEVEECNFHSNLLIDDEPLQVLPKLAVAIGLDEAIVVQQLHYWLNPKRKAGKVLNGKRWIYNTYAEWRETNFPFWSEIHIKRIFLILEKCGIIISCQPEGRFSRRKYYRLNEGFMLKAKRGELGIKKNERIKQIRSTDQLDTLVVSKSTVPSTETTSESTTENTKSVFSKTEAGIYFQCTPELETKAEKLAVIPPPIVHPSEAEFDSFLNAQDLQYVIDYKPELYDDLCRNKWHVWKKGRWNPIHNWRKYVEALNDRIERDKNRQ